MCSSGAVVTLYCTLRQFLQLQSLPTVTPCLITLTATDRRGRRDQLIWRTATKYDAISNRKIILTFSGYGRSTMDMTEPTILLQIRRRSWTNGWKHCVMSCIWTTNVSYVQNYALFFILKYCDINAFYCCNYYTLLYCSCVCVCVCVLYFNKPAHLLTIIYWEWQVDDLPWNAV